MKAIIIDNGGLMRTGEGKYACHYQTGMFGVELQKLGCKVTYLQIYTDTDTSINTCVLNDHGINVVAIKRQKSKILTYLKAYSKAFRVMFSSDLIYIYWPTSFKYVSLFALLFKKKYGLYVRGEKDQDGVINRFIIKHASFVATVSDHFTHKIQNYGVKNTFTIKPMVDLMVDDIIVDRKLVKKEKYTLLFLGRVEHDKGIRELLDAFILLRAEYNVHLSIVGDGSAIPYVRQFIDKNQVHEHITVRGALNTKDEIKNAFTDSDIYVLPTYHEGFPRTLYEAMAYSIPIVTTFVGGIPAMLRDKVHCRSIEVKSVTSIKDVVSEMLSSYESLSLLTDNSKRLICSVLDPNRPSHAASVFHQLSNLYE